MDKITIKIKQSAFCNFMFSDKESQMGVCERLIDQGSVSLQEYIDDVGYIPINIIENIKDVRKEDIKDNEIEEPSGLYKMELI